MENITHLTVRYERTESLPEYRNVKIGLAADVIVPPGEDPDNLLLIAHQQLESYVLEALDQERERDGMAARYDTGPRYNVHHWVDFDETYVLDADVSAESLPGSWRFIPELANNHRASVIRTLFPAARWALSDLSEGQALEYLWECLATAWAIVRYTQAGGKWGFLLVPAPWTRNVKRYHLRYFSDIGAAQQAAEKYAYSCQTPATTEEFEKICPGIFDHQRDRDARADFGDDMPF